jgi:hypothetical protein
VLGYNLYVKTVYTVEKSSQEFKSLKNLLKKRANFVLKTYLIMDKIKICEIAELKPGNYII